MLDLTMIETRDSILLRIQRLTNGVYFDDTNYNEISVPVKGNLRFELPSGVPPETGYTSFTQRSTFYK